MVNLHHPLTTLTVNFFSYCFNAMSFNFICLLLVFLILDSSQKGLTLSSLLSWVLTDASEIFPEPSLLQDDQSSSVSHPLCARCSDPITFVFFYLAPCSTCSCLPHTGKARTGHTLRCVSPRQSRGEGSPHLDLLAVLFLIQPRTVPTFTVTKVCQSLALLSLLTTRTSRSFSAKLLSRQLVSSL